MKSEERIVKSTKKKKPLTRLFFLARVDKKDATLFSCFDKKKSLEQTPIPFSLVKSVFFEKAMLAAA